MRTKTRYWILPGGSPTSTTDTWMQVDDPTHPKATLDENGVPWVLVAHSEPPDHASEIDLAAYNTTVAEADKAEKDRQTADDVRQAQNQADREKNQVNQDAARAVILKRLGLTADDWAVLTG